MEAAAEREDRGTPCRLPRELDRALDGLGARVLEDEGVDAAGKHVAQHLPQRHGGLGRRHADVHMHELSGLIRDGADDRRMAVADRRDRDAAGQVEDATSVLGDEPGSLSPLERQPCVVAEDR
ncbi:MAG: hypothetical protein HYY42_02640 [Chloroflexi bacterium]|nr:hypothetical protein [Chloroflexota bacterium]